MNASQNDVCRERNIFRTIIFQAVREAERARSFFYLPDTVLATKLDHLVEQAWTLEGRVFAHRLAGDQADISGRTEPARILLTTLLGLELQALNLAIDNELEREAAIGWDDDTEENINELCCAFECWLKDCQALAPPIAEAEAFVSLQKALETPVEKERARRSQYISSQLHRV